MVVNRSMSTSAYFRLAVFLVLLTLGGTAFFAWRADRRDRSQLAAELASTKQLLATAEAHQHDRDTQLAQTLASLAEKKRTVITPAQILRELPATLPLPALITLQTSSATTESVAPPVAQAFRPEGSRPQALARQAAKPAAEGSQPPPQPAVIPVQDLKPLYDFTLDCKACQAKLTVAQSDLADERTKTAALTKERDDALRIAKGGSVWRRIGRAAKWLIIGAAAGAVLSRGH